ncbi:MAG: hypothetical protein CO113_09860 [Elusimicrobia bacterium CG_4_9_14_3_um_filter_62_55]|nr:MAG: hypothetical protein CO113_09860 [Elusimicrobia bacterium CG_4_9_14_3_um_filter_62_55]
MKAAAKEDKALRKRVAKDSAPWLARLGGEACLGDDCFSVNPAAPAPAPLAGEMIGLSLPAKRLLAAKLREEISAAKPAGRPAPFTPDPKAREAFLNSPQALEAYAGLNARSPRAQAIAAARLAKELFGNGPDAPAAAATLAGEGGRSSAADGWVDAFEAAGLEHGAALSRAYAVWERLPSP